MACINTILPPEILTIILEKLKFCDLLNAKATCRSWKSLVLALISTNNRVKMTSELYSALDVSIIIGGGKTNPKMLPAYNFQFLGPFQINIPPLPLEAYDGYAFNHKLFYTDHLELMFLNSINGDVRILRNGQWKLHSKTLESRDDTQCVMMPKGLYMFGGRNWGDKSNSNNSAKSSEILTSGSNVWKKGPMIPGKGLILGCGLAISSKELILIGGMENDMGIPLSRVMKLNVDNDEWTILPNLREVRVRAVAAYFNNKVIVSGGSRHMLGRPSKTTEIIPISKLYSKVANTTNPISYYGGDLHFARPYPRMGIIKINGKRTLIIFDDRKHPEIEEWDDENEVWKISSLTLNQDRMCFAHVYKSQAF